MSRLRGTNRAGRMALNAAAYAVTVFLLLPTLILQRNGT